MRKRKIKNLLLGKFDPTTYENFIIVNKEYHKKEKMYLQKETVKSFSKMRKQALSDNINLKIISGTRNFHEQKLIWEQKYKEYKSSGISDLKIISKIMEWSAMPTTSRHHWGTDIDINGFDDYFKEGNLQADLEYRWLQENAKEFGFQQVYTKKEKGKRTSGYNEEKWHWSYMPIARNYLNLYKELITYKDITGFSGSEFAKELDIINRYIISGIFDK